MKAITSVCIDTNVLQKAKENKLNVSQICEKAIEATLRDINEKPDQPSEN